MALALHVRQSENPSSSQVVYFNVLWTNDPPVMETLHQTSLHTGDWNCLHVWVSSRHWCLNLHPPSFWPECPKREGPSSSQIWWQAKFHWGSWEFFCSALFEDATSTPPPELGPRLWVCDKIYLVLPSNANRSWILLVGNVGMLSIHWSVWLDNTCIEWDMSCLPIYGLLLSEASRSHECVLVDAIRVCPGIETWVIIHNWMWPNMPLSDTLHQGLFL